MRLYRELLKTSFSEKKPLFLKNENKNWAWGEAPQDRGFAPEPHNFKLCSDSAVFQNLSEEMSKQVFRDAL